MYYPHTNQQTTLLFVSIIHGKLRRLGVSDTNASNTRRST
ncbi:MAG: hypothetical protein BAJATHORv1_20154 [Candidatus Thorarchaeota archaeon]|nr:MAG: hypothetical protein BAJATHORv1_20154 [Candidatus Thorarchaeota archaeon]